MSDDKIKAQLRNAGVPREVFSTTLVKESLTELREYVLAGAARQKRVAYIHQTLSRTSLYADKAELAFYLTAKELVLSGEDVFCCNLVDIHTALFKDTDEASALAQRLDGMEAGFIGIRYFHDKGGRVDQFMSPYEIAYFSSWMIRRYQDGVGFLLLGSEPIMGAIDWWPASFLGYLRGRAVQFEVHK